MDDEEFEACINQFQLDGEKFLESMEEQRKTDVQKIKRFFAERKAKYSKEELRMKNSDYLETQRASVGSGAVKPSHTDVLQEVFLLKSAKKAGRKKRTTKQTTLKIPAIMNEDTSSKHETLLNTLADEDLDLSLSSLTPAMKKLVMRNINKIGKKITKE